MKLVDANVLIHAVNSDSPRHEVSRRWLDSALSGDETVAFTWVVLLAFLRLTTSPHVFVRAWSVDDACEQVGQWLSARAAVVVEPSSRHAQVLCGLLEQVGTGGNLTTDAHLAACALEHRAEVVSFDGDFDRLGIRHSVPS